MSQNYDHLVKAHRLRSLAEIFERETHPEIEGFDHLSAVLAGVMRELADGFDPPYAMKD
jgi:hypothetical protein